MSGRISQYQLLKDTYEIVREMRDDLSQQINKVNIRVDKLDRRVNNVENATSNLLGKIGIGIMIVSAAISLIFTLIYEKIFK